MQGDQNVESYNAQAEDAHHMQEETVVKNSNLRQDKKRRNRKSFEQMQELTKWYD